MDLLAILLYWMESHMWSLRIHNHLDIHPNITCWSKFWEKNIHNIHHSMNNYYSQPLQFGMKYIHYCYWLLSEWQDIIPDIALNNRQKERNKWGNLILMNRWYNYFHTKGINLKNHILHQDKWIHNQCWKEKFRKHKKDKYL